ncbi:MAG: metallopeptidase TldD-related protein [Candidatus Krumholzibacteriia bacterium]
MFRIHTILLVLLFLAGPGHGAAPDMIMQAMEDEMARSMQSLRVENLERPYFMAFRIDETAAIRAEATFGSLVTSSETTKRDLKVEVRIGDASLDNTNYFSLQFDQGTLFGVGESNSIPLDDSYQEIRRKLWLATDEAYKQALEKLSKKRAALENKTRSEELNDFAAAEPATVIDPDAGPPPDLARASALAKELSLLFREMPQVSSSNVSISGTTVITRYVNSEGTKFQRSSPEVSLVARAEGYAPDGLPLREFAAFFGRTMGDLPPKEKLAGEIRAIGVRINEMSAGQILETYNGPVLFEDGAAAEILAQVFLPRLVASRQMVTDNAQMEMFLRSQGGSLADKIGARVLPVSMKLEDSPALDRFGSERLLGGYSIDDDGVPAGKTVLVEGGILKALLGTRNPARGALKSTGNRRGEGASPTNVILTAQGGLKEKKLREKLLSLVKERGLEYGVIVRRMGNPYLIPASGDLMASAMRIMGGGGQGEGIEGALAAYKIYPDGREEVVRNVAFDEVGVSSFKDVVAASDAPAAVTFPYTRGGMSAMAERLAAIFGAASAGPPLITVVTPDLLFEEITLKKPGGDVPKPPIAQHPYFAR